MEEREFKPGVRFRYEEKEYTVVRTEVVNDLLVEVHTEPPLRLMDGHLLNARGGLARYCVLVEDASQSRPVEYMPGMKFRVPENAPELFDRVDGRGWVPSMDKYIGQIVTLECLWRGGPFWDIEEDSGEHCWDPSLMEYVPEGTQNEREESKLDNEDVKAEVTRGDAKRIIVPEGMSYNDAREWLTRQEKHEETTIEVSQIIEAHPVEAAVAFVDQLNETYGYMQMVSHRGGFFGMEEIKPTLVSVRVGTGDEDVVQVPWGHIKLPGVEGHLEIGFSRSRKRGFEMALNGEIKRKHEDEVMELIAKTRQRAKESSLFRGKALRFFKTDSPSSLEDLVPGFLDLSTVEEGNLVFSQSVLNQIETALFTPIESTKRCRELNIPLKRGVLLSGPYGTGKTLTAYVTAKKCRENGWTFLLLQDVSDLPEAIRFARRYEPCVIFAEDLDQVLGTDDRDEKVNEILNTMDGVDSKEQSIMVVLTTNHLDSINRAVLRPGRLDAVIDVQPPDAWAAQQLIRTYGGDTLAVGENFDLAAERLAGNIPAVIREVVERSKLAALRRTPPGEPIRVTNEDIVVSADSMISHLEQIKERAPDTREPIERAADTLAAARIREAELKYGAGHKEESRANGKAASVGYEGAPQDIPF